jgi:hypothetical protein
MECVVILLQRPLYGVKAKFLRDTLYQNHLRPALIGEGTFLFHAYQPACLKELKPNKSFPETGIKSNKIIACRDSQEFE